ncbi:MAG: pyridoxal phosphate-dependent aminotransferase [Anaerolineaceae bacterium]|nr:MAG: pyridoxal phosphate-dependent aminotransferase [Anaerolineaceae bacterium]
MKINFDKIIDRAGTNSSKWETIQSEANAYIHVRAERFFGEDAATPMWIADMDFAAPKEVVDALTARAKHGLYGYTESSLTYKRSVADWMKSRHDWDVQPEWILNTPGVVPALAMLVRAFLKAGEKTIIQPPVYYPFRLVLEFNEIEVVENPLVYEGSHYYMNIADLEQKARDPQTKMLILSSPHNPVGRVWTRDELARLSEICRANGVLVISDEIHADLTFTPFIPFGALDENTIVCTAASKTFNLAGLANSNIIIPNQTLRRQFEKYLFQNALADTNLFGRLATETAYTHGADWLNQLLDYLSGTLDFMEKYFAESIPQIRMIRPEGTYLVWLDCRALGMDASSLHRFFADRARVYLENGAVFGTGGDGFLRMNIATPRKVVKEALRRMKEAVNSLEEKK